MVEATNSMNEFGDATRNSGRNVDSFNASVSQAVGQVTLFEQAISGVLRVLPTDEIRRWEQSNYDLARSHGVNIVEIRKMEKEVDRISKTTDQYSKQSIQGMIAQLKSSNTLMGLANQHTSKYVESLVKLGRGAEDTAKMLEQLAQSSSSLNISLGKGEITTADYFEAYIVGGRRGVAAISNFAVAQADAVDSNIEKMRDLDAAFEATSTGWEDFSLKMGKGMKEAIDPSTISFGLATVKVLAYVAALGVAAGAVKRLALGAGSLAGIGRKGGVGGGIASAAAGAAGPAIPGFKIPIPLPVIVTGSTTGGVGGGVGGGVPFRPTTAGGGGEAIGTDASGKPIYSPIAGRGGTQAWKRGGYIPNIGVPQRGGPGLLRRGIGRAFSSFGGRMAIGAGLGIAGSMLRPEEGAPLTGMNQARGVAGTTAQFAGAGAMFGPMGAAVGALAGLAKGSWDLKKAAEAGLKALEGMSAAALKLRDFHAVQAVMVDISDALREAKAAGLDELATLDLQSEKLRARTPELEKEVQAHQKVVMAQRATVASLDEADEGWGEANKNLVKSESMLKNYNIQLDENRKKRVELFAATLQMIKAEADLANVRGMASKRATEAAELFGRPVTRMEAGARQEDIRREQKALRSEAGRYEREAGQFALSGDEEKAVEFRRKAEEARSKALAMSAEIISLETRDLDDQLKIYSNLQGTADALLGIEGARGGNFEREEQFLRDKEKLSGKALSAEKSRMRRLVAMLDTAQSQEELEETSILISQQRTRLSQAELQVVKDRLAAEDVAAQKAKFRMEMVEKSVELRKMEFGFLTGITGIEEKIAGQGLDQLALSAKIVSNEKAMAILAAERPPERAKELSTEEIRLEAQNQILKKQKEQNAAQIEYNKTYALTIRNLDHEGDLMGQRIELAKLTKQPLLAAGLIQERLANVEMPKLVKLNQELSFLRKNAPDEIEAIRQKELEVAKAATDIAKSVDFVRREWSEMFTEQMLNLPTGSFTTPTGPSGFAQFGPAFTPFQRREAGAKPTGGLGTRSTMLRQIFGQTGRSGFEQNLTSIMSNLNQSLSGGLDVRVTGEIETPEGTARITSVNG